MSQAHKDEGLKVKWRLHDNQHNDIQPNDTQHKGIIGDIQHKWHSG